MRTFLRILCGCALLIHSPSPQAGDRLLGTPGASALEGGAGGGMVPWAVLAGYGTAEQIGGSAFASRVHVQDYRLDSTGAAMTFHNRLELSVTRQSLDLGSLGQAIGQPGARLRQDIIGGKLRLLGDLIYTPWPQLSLGVQYKQQRDFAIPSSVGAVRASDVDIYLAASKLWLTGPFDRSLLVNLTARATRANQLGLLGFGGDQRDRHRLVFEGSAALLLTRELAAGVEYRQKPNNLGFAREDDWRDVFLAWFPNKHLTAVVAYTWLGSIAGFADQHGPYVSLQLSY